MESLIINRKKQQVMIFQAFSANRKGITSSIEADTFWWSDDKSGVEYRINRDWDGTHDYMKKINSLDYDVLIEHFESQWKNFQNDVTDSNIKYANSQKKADIVDLTSGDPSAKLCVAANELIKLMKSDYHPHATALVTQNSVEIVEGVLNIPDVSASR
jgi:hypothetical protein